MGRQKAIFPKRCIPGCSDVRYDGLMHPHIPWELIVASAVKLLKIFGIIPGAVAAMGVRRIIQKRLQQKAMEGWPATDARIQSASVHREGRRHWVEITYSYYVGEYRAGTYVRAFKREQQADDFVRQMKEKAVRTHYNESDPDRSVILDRDIEMIVLLAPQYG